MMVLSGIWRKSVVSIYHPQPTKGSIMSEIDIEKIVNQLDDLAVNIRVLNFEYGFLTEENSSKLQFLMLRTANALDKIIKQTKEQ
jgi:hypothetical protein